MPDRFAVKLDADDYAAFQIYDQLPARVKAMVRTVVALNRSDQHLIQRLVATLRRASASSGSPDALFLPRPGRERRQRREFRLVERRSTPPAA